MSGKIKIAVSWAAACGGCDVSLLDSEERILELAAVADIVYWPVAMDFKRDELEAMPDQSVDIGLFNGAVRTTEQADDARLFRRKCKLLVAYGSCACFGGIPGLANLADREQILDTAFAVTPSTENPDEVRPQTRWPLPDGRELTLPDLFESVHSLNQLVPVDVAMPGCPPPRARVDDLIDVALAYAADGTLPPAGIVLADDRALCATCPRGATRVGGRIAEIRRPHELVADPERCFLDQGVVCLGIATRGGCEATCIAANMPCRGCFGPTADALDPGAAAMSAIGSIAGSANENDVPAHQMKKAVLSLRDPAGTFYRFTLPSALLDRWVRDKPEEHK